MKNLILTIILLFTVATNAQYAIISAIDVKEGSDEGYLKLEEFFGPIHDATIEAGVQNSQTVFKVTSEGQNEDYPDYIIITGFSSKEQLDAYNESWSTDAWTNFARRVYRGKMSGRAISKMMNSVGDYSNERRNYHVELVAATPFIGGDWNPGDKASMNPMIKKNDDFENYETKVWMPLIQKEVLKGNHGGWAFVNIYEKNQNAYENLTHMVFNKNNESSYSDEMMETIGTFKYQKLFEGLAESRDMLDAIELEVISSH